MAKYFEEIEYSIKTETDWQKTMDSYEEAIQHIQRKEARGIPLIPREEEIKYQHNRALKMKPFMEECMQIARKKYSTARATLRLLKQFVSLRESL